METDDSSPMLSEDATSPNNSQTCEVFHLSNLRLCATMKKFISSAVSSCNNFPNRPELKKRIGKKIFLSL